MVMSGLINSLRLFTPSKVFFRLKTTVPHVTKPRFLPNCPKYYPRWPDEKDPEFVPSKLLRIERIKPMKGTTKTEKYILNQYKMGTSKFRVAIVKNIPEVCNILWTIKHLIVVTPITFPYGEPTADDIKNTILLQNGKCIVTKKLMVPQECIDSRNKLYEDPRRLDGPTIKKFCRLKWLSGWSGGF